MPDDASAGRRRLIDRIGRLSVPVLIAIGVFIASGVGAGGYYAYRTYDYIEHDNDFCLSCHLMVEPYELFAESAHQGLGCKACHRPNLMQRSQMAITQVVANPDSLSVHAEVPDAVCTECHVDGDPERWRSIANTAGHEVHLESDDPALAELECVGCHSSSLHEFTAVDQTCAQSGCHTDTSVQLGAMSNLSIHCAACHTFVAPVEEEGILGSAQQAALLPDRDECFACHAMRTLVEMPDDDPHEGGCAACHNPHEQTTPAEAAQGCATAGCHLDPVDLTSFHRGIDPDDLANCLYCHQAHDFALDGSDCAACHQGAQAPVEALAVSGGESFSHDLHQTVGCGSCHDSAEAHGTPTATTPADCRACHHTPPTSASCLTCHGSEDAPQGAFVHSQPMNLSVGVSVVDRAMTFPHGAHDALDCASCHTEGIDMAVSPQLDCASCHQDHHTPVSDCASCHVAAPPQAHPPEQAHITCSGAGCHTDVPFETVPRTRAFCLGCHQDQTDHQPGGVCVDCHVLPAPLPQGGGGP